MENPWWLQVIIVIIMIVIIINIVIIDSKNNCLCLCSTFQVGCARIPGNKIKSLLGNEVLGGERRKILDFL